jgi:hypothetical protein
MFNPAQTRAIVRDPKCLKKPVMGVKIALFPYYRAVHLNCGRVRVYRPNPDPNYKPNPNPTNYPLFTSFYFLRNGYSG